MSSIRRKPERVRSGKRKRRTAYTSGRLELIGFESQRKKVSIDGKKTRRKISSSAKSKLDRHPFARTAYRYKKWRKW